MFYLTRDLGFVSKLYRGLAGDVYDPDGPDITVEKPWIAALEGFAIGGGCQLLLVLDHVIAEEGSYFNLPVRKEGIIPGAAPLRLPRFVGARMAQHGILFDKTFHVESPEARCGRRHGIRGDKRRGEPQGYPYRPGAARAIPTVHGFLLP